MDRYTKSRNKASHNLRMKASSLYFLNDISNIDATDSPEKTDNWRDEYTFNPMIIGRGHFSKVYKVKQCETGITFAIKVIRRRRLGTDKIDDIMQEIEIMQILNKSSNSGFIQLFKVHTSPPEVGIVMEFASGGAIYHVTQDSRIGLPEVYVRIILTKVLSAISVLHQQNIVHLDIKADNILLRHPYPSTDVVLTDFGLARKLIKSKVHKEMIGTPDYIAPEVVNYEQICLKSDMWSVGVLAYFVLTNVSPFSGISKDDTLRRVTKAEYELVGSLNDESLIHARDFIGSLLVKIPEKRMSAEDCLLHDFLSSVNIIECSQEKSSSVEAPVINLEYDLPILSNNSYRLRGMAMSQYDINTSHQTGSENDLLNTNSAADLEMTKSSEKYESSENISNDKCISLHGSKDSQVNVDYVENESQVEDDNSKQCYKEMEEIEEIIENIRNNITQEDKSLVNNKDDAYDEDTKSATNVQLENCNYENENVYSGNADNNNNSFSEMTSSCFESASVGEHEFDYIMEISTSESYSILIKDEICKDNDLPKEHISKESFNGTHNLQKKETQESRKRCNDNNNSKCTLTKCSLINQSFRSSRDNILEYNRTEKEQYALKAHRMKMCNTIDHSELNSAYLKQMNGVVKRRALSKSIKKDSDKPQKLYECNRRSELVTNTDYLDNIPCNYKRNISASNPTLNNSPHGSKSKFDFLNIFRKKKLKEANKSKMGCLLS